jgi:two-component system sensor histidine kinase AlgZ
MDRGRPAAWDFWAPQLFAFESGKLSPIVKRARFWAWVALIDAAASVIAPFIEGAARWGMPFGAFFKIFRDGFIVSSCCVAASILAAPSFARAFRRLPSPLNWMAIVAMIAAVAAAASLFGFGIGAVIGDVDRFAIVHTWLTQGLRASIIYSLVFGIYFMTAGILRAELREKTLALRTKERDEADARRLATEAQLASLESRVQPHFLFNTLNSIAALATRNPEGAERMTVQLSALLRASLDADPRALVPLKEELETLRMYLGIERVRFGDRLRDSIEVPSSLLDVEIPRLSLQSLVENSIKYAVAPRRQGASIAINASQSDDCVRIQVDDDGPGFPGAPIPEGHGLALLKARLSMIFGAAGTLTFHNRPGASVLMEIPLRRTGRHE